MSGASRLFSVSKPLRMRMCTLVTEQHDRRRPCKRTHRRVHSSDNDRTSFYETSADNDDNYTRKPHSRDRTRICTDLAMHSTQNRRQDSLFYAPLPHAISILECMCGKTTTGHQHTGAYAFEHPTQRDSCKYACKYDRCVRTRTMTTARMLLSPPCAAHAYKLARHSIVKRTQARACARVCCFHNALSPVGRAGMRFQNRTNPNRWQADNGETDSTQSIETHRSHARVFIHKKIRTNKTRMSNACKSSSSKGIRRSPSTRQSINRRGIRRRRRNMSSANWI